MRIPSKMNDDLLQILGTPNFHCHPIARAMRTAGEPIPHKSEAEQAYVLLKLLSIYAVHGINWRAEASKWLQELRIAATPDPLGL